MVNRYKTRYDKLINFYLNNLTDGFVEKHHILPKCMGGDNSVSNLILLPVRAHFIAHYLLHRAYPENTKLAHAFAMMGVSNEYQRRSSKLYEKTKIARSSALKGVPRPEWVKEKLRKPKQNTSNYKKPKTHDHCKNISKSLSCIKRTPEHNENLRKSLKNYYEKRKTDHLDKVNYYRKLFLESGVTRKEFYKMHNDISSSALKKYLTGL